MLRDFNKQSRRVEIIICLFLAVISLCVYWPVRNHDFVAYDTIAYVSENRHVIAGLTVEGIVWAFTTFHAANWHPLTWLSHMLDCELYGLDPSGHHLTNLLFHMANTLLLFLVLRRMTKTVWQSAFVAALFAVHPLHIESVAWVAERKDVLSTFFWLLTMWGYVRYVERRGCPRYLLVLLAFALGLMVKPMLVTLPFVLLLLDYWPLNRMRVVPSVEISNSTQSQSVRSKTQKAVVIRLGLEKLPLMVLAAGSSIVTFVGQKGAGAVQPLEVYSIDVRIANAFISYIDYIGKMIWPQNLGVIYPHLGDNVAIWKAFVAGLFVVFICVQVLRSARRFPFLPVGWFWYLGTLVPVIGLVQVGRQAIADRFTYVPLIGLFMIIAWGVHAITARWRFQKRLLAIFTGLLLSGYITCTMLQLRHWRNTFTLFEHALNVTANNHIAHFGLANALLDRGELDEAIAHFSEAIRIKPDYPEALTNMGVALARKEKTDEAIGYFSHALRINPKIDVAHVAHYYLGEILFKQGELDRAVKHFSEVLRIEPDDADVHFRLGMAMVWQGELEEAVKSFSEALRINPEDARVQKKLGIALLQQGNFDKAARHLSEALRINPEDAEAHNNLGAAFYEQGKFEEAIKHLSSALRFDPDNRDVRDNLEMVSKLLDKSDKPLTSSEKANITKTP